MSGYTKLFNSILASTIWREDDKTRIVWITMLAMADRNGVVESSLPGLADFARVSIPDCKAALGRLSSPDEHSRTQGDEGRRIRTVDGGWEIINHAKYREKMGADERKEYNRKAQAKWRERQTKSTNVNDSKLPSIRKEESEQSKHIAEAEAEAEAEAVNPSPLVPSEQLLSGKPDESAPSRPEKLEGIPKKTLRIQKARPVLAHLNAKAGRVFQERESNLLLIAARLEEVGWDAEGCKVMIDRMCARWLGTDQAEYLRPETLFGKQKFGGYYDNRELPVITAGQSHPEKSSTAPKPDHLAILESL